jgi:transcriptional regulator with XRE-family HTH domain
MQALDIFIKNTQEVMKKIRWSQNDLAKKTNIPQPAISKLFTRKKEASIQTCEKIANAFGLQLAELFRSDSIPELKIKPESEVIDGLLAVAEAQHKRIKTLERQLLPTKPLIEKEGIIESDKLKRFFEALSDPNITTADDFNFIVRAAEARLGIKISIDDKSKSGLSDAG